MSGMAEKEEWRLHVLFSRSLKNIDLRKTPRVRPAGYGGFEQALGWEIPRYCELGLRCFGDCVSSVYQVSDMK